VSFANPAVLVALLAVPLVLALHVLARSRRQRYAIRYPALDTLAGVVPAAGGAWRRRIPPALFLLSLVALVAALARPEMTVSVPVERASVVLVTDVSRSMEATDVSPDRLSAARNAANDFLDEVPESLRVGLVSYSTAADSLQTPTTEHAAVREALDSLQPIEGTSTGAGLNAALEDLKNSVDGDRRRPPSAIVLLSDGSATDGDAQYRAAEEARQLGIPIYTVALGTSEGVVTLPGGRQLNVPPDPEALERIARTSGGAAFLAEDADELAGVYERLGSQIGTKEEPREVTAAFAGGALILLLGAVAGSLRWAGRLP
jgi:Ca-activated chloride channel homolog